MGLSGYIVLTMTTLLDPSDKLSNSIVKVAAKYSTLDKIDIHPRTVNHALLPKQLICANAKIEYWSA